MIRFIGGKDVINNMNIFKNIIIDNYGGIIDNTYNNTLYNNKLIIIVRPKQKFNNNEFNDIINYINNGGSLLILSNEGGDGLYNSNINYLLNNYDININNNTVIGTIHNNNYHPKEVIIKYNKYKFIYPYGCTLDNSNRDYNKILLNSGNLSYPINKPISIINNNGNGKICVIGSHMLFNDNYINKEDNTLLADIILKYLLNNTDKDYDNGMIEFNNNIYNNMNNISIPNTRLLADMLKSCLQHDQQYSTEQQQQQQLSGSGSGRVEGIYNNIMMDNLPIVLNTYNKLIRSIGGKSGGYIVNGGGKYNNNTKRVLSVIKPHFITINGLINNTYKFTSSPALIPPLLYNIYNNGESGHHQQQQQQQSMDNNNQYHHQQQYHQPNLEMYDLEDELSSYSQRLNTLIINKYNNIIQFDENNNNIGNFIKDACSSINDDNMIMRVNYKLEYNNVSMQHHHHHHAHITDNNNNGIYKYDTIKYKYMLYNIYKYISDYKT